jgi:hypothetical protein
VGEPYGGGGHVHWFTSRVPHAPGGVVGGFATPVPANVSQTRLHAPGVGMGHDGGVGGAQGMETVAHVVPWGSVSDGVEGGFTPVHGSGSNAWMMPAPASARTALSVLCGNHGDQRARFRDPPPGHCASASAFTVLGWSVPSSAACTPFGQRAGFVDEKQLSGGQSAEMASAAVSGTKPCARGESRFAPSASKSNLDTRHPAELAEMIRELRRRAAHGSRCCKRAVETIQSRSASA